MKNDKLGKKMRKDLEKRMCDDQPIQLDCRVETCIFHANAQCNHKSPAISLNANESFICWSKRDRGEENAKQLIKLRKKAKKLFSKAEALCKGIKSKKGKIAIQKIFKKSEKKTEQADDLEWEIKKSKRDGKN